MKKIFFFLLFFSISHLEGHENFCPLKISQETHAKFLDGDVSEQEADHAMIQNSQEPLFVSLGSWCNVAGYLKQEKMRKAAFPFDWILSIDSEKFLEIFSTDFRYFLDNNYLFVKDWHIYNNYYRLQCIHEYTQEDILNKTKPDELLKTFKQKYQRRIYRFKELKDYRGKVYFIRSASVNSNDPAIYFKCTENLTISDNYAKRLFSTLKAQFTRLDFTLIIIDKKQPKKKLTEKIIRLQEVSDLKSI